MLLDEQNYGTSLADKQTTDKQPSADNLVSKIFTVPRPGSWLAVVAVLSLLGGVVGGIIGVGGGANWLNRLTGDSLAVSTPTNQPLPNRLQPIEEE